MTEKEKEKLLKYITHLEQDLDRKDETIRYLKAEWELQRENSLILYEENQRVKNMLKEKIYGI